LEYRFRLNNGHWSAWSSTQETVWPLLPLGTNTLSASVRNARNLKALGTYQTSFVVPKPWFAQPAAWGLLLALLAGLGGWLWRARRQRLAERKAWQVEKEDLEKRALRLQMNPHFLFNALESISGFVLQSQPKEAVGYLQRFAKLMRLTLQSAQKSWIPLADEWHLLEHYIALEQVRFNHSFEVVWEPDASLDPEELGIPPMVLQPVVENAILHGLRPLAQGGILRIRWEKVDENRLAITVEDNGVGRQAAGQAVRTDETRHRSAATSLLVARLDHLAQQFGPGIGWTTTDLIHPDGSPAGTRVTLVVPVEYLETF
jgi:LytS/YehU family sensor histidine kinase